MAIVLIEMKYHYSLLESPIFIADNINSYKKRFLDWSAGYQESQSRLGSNKEAMAIKDFLDIKGDDNGQPSRDEEFAAWLNRFVIHSESEKAFIGEMKDIKERDEAGALVVPEVFSCVPHISL